MTEHVRVEVDREDLLAEATALVDRVEFMVDGFVEPVVIGFRKSGAASLFVGQDPAYHFTSTNELRRAYVRGELFKADGGRLAAMTRRRDATTVALVRRDLAAAEQEAFLADLLALIERLRAAFAAGRYTVRGEVSTTADATERAIEWLAKLLTPPMIARAPNVR